MKVKFEERQVKLSYGTRTGYVACLNREFGIYIYLVNNIWYRYFAETGEAPKQISEKDLTNIVYCACDKNDDEYLEAITDIHNFKDQKMFDFMSILKF